MIICAILPWALITCPFIIPGWRVDDGESATFRGAWIRSSNVPPEPVSLTVIWLVESMRLVDQPIKVGCASLMSNGSLPSIGFSFGMPKRGAIIECFPARAYELQGPLQGGKCMPSPLRADKIAR